MHPNHNQARPFNRNSSGGPSKGPSHGSSRGPSHGSSGKPSYSSHGSPSSRPSHGSHGGPSRGPSSKPSRGYSHGGSSHTQYRGAPHKSARRSGGFNQKSFSDVSKFINKVSVTETSEVFQPEHAFNDFEINDKLKAAIEKKGYKIPTPIQDKAIPHILKGADIVGIANTGTGKTAAFLLPLIDKVLRNPKENIIIMVPTRELATQIQDELRGFTYGMGIFSTCCVGGVSIFGQIKSLRNKNNFIIGTPGRLKDLIERKCIRLNEISTIVLDEADRMLDMGFINDVKFVMSLMPEKRHTLFFSATLSAEVNALISKFLKIPVTISVKKRDTSHTIDQNVVRVERGQDKQAKLVELLKTQNFSKVLIFGKTKHGVERLSNYLNSVGLKTDSIHGNKNFNGRQRALNEFKAGRVQALVATDVAARGLDISDITHVINFDLPATYDDYIHRIGRTGRGGKAGKALTFV